MNIAITGHRPGKLWGYDLELPQYENMKAWIKSLIEKELETHNKVNMISGMALGVDTIYALCALDFKNQGKPVTLTAAIPFTGQEGKWPYKSQNMYRNILSKADEKVIVCEGTYAAWKMQKRNEWMVDHSEKLIAIWDGTSGGTENCISYAKSIGKEIIFANPKEF